MTATGGVGGIGAIVYTPGSTCVAGIAGPTMVTAPRGGRTLHTTAPGATDVAARGVLGGIAGVQEVAVVPFTMSRDTSLGANFTGVTYYDGQGFLVKKSLKVNSAG